MENFQIRKLPPAEIEQVVRDMDEQGYARVAGIVSTETLTDARRFVLEELRKHSGEYFSYIGREPVRSSPMGDLGGSPALRDIFSRIYERGLGKPAPQESIFQVLRVLAGKTGLKEAYQFHYDAYVITALMPILIPSEPGEKRGDLIIYPKLRRIRSNVVLNVIEKILLQNRAAQRLASTRAIRRLLGAKVLRMEPGDIYFFWGYQSLHGNEPCYTTSVRSTALFHFGNPHENSRLVTAIQGWRRRHEQKIRERAMARAAQRPS